MRAWVAYAAGVVSLAFAALFSDGPGGGRVSAALIVLGIGLLLAALIMGWES